MKALLLLLLSLPGGPPGGSTLPQPADAAASSGARQLYQRLHRRTTLFGHQDDPVAGAGWRDQPNRSDVVSAGGAYPAVFGWDLGNVGTGKSYNFDGVPFAAIRAGIRQAAGRGGINTISWHLPNPVTGGTAWDTTGGTVAAVLPGGPQHQQYRQRLDSLARFIQGLTDAQGQAIPLIFRPFHEHTGFWFWWGQRHCTTAEYIRLWRFTVDYLRRDKKLHSLLLAYSAADFRSASHYLERYPGDAYVDILGFDTYCSADVRPFRQQLERQLATVTKLAQAHHKLVALTETGCTGPVPPQWWTQALLPPLARYRPAYVLVWRSTKPDLFFAPGPGRCGRADFGAFKSSPVMVFGVAVKKAK